MRREREKGTREKKEKRRREKGEVLPPSLQQPKQITSPSLLQLFTAAGCNFNLHRASFSRERGNGGGKEEEEEERGGMEGYIKEMHGEISTEHNNSSKFKLQI